MIDKIIHLLNSIEFWTILGSIGTIISLVLTFLNKHHTQITLEIDGIKINKKKPIAIHYFCPYHNSISQYRIPFLLNYRNTSSKTIKNIRYSIEADMKKLKGDDKYENYWMKRFLEESESNNGKQKMDSETFDLLPYDSYYFLDELILDNTNLSPKGMDCFAIRLDITHENIAKPYHVYIFVVAFICDNYNNWKQIIAEQDKTVPKKTIESFQRYIVFTKLEIDSHNNKFNKCIPFNKEAIQKLN